MLLCSGCGGQVSEYAARCPGCRRSIDDAVEIPDREPDPVPGGQPYGDPPFAGTAWPLDFQPNVQRLVGHFHSARARGRLVVLAAAGAVLLVAVGAAVSMGADRTSTASGLSGLDGRVVAASSAGPILRVDPASGRAVPFSLSKLQPQLAFLANSPDGTAWLDSTGDAINFSGTKISQQPTAAASQLSGGRSLTRSETFADKGRAVVVLTRAAFRPAEAELITLSSGVESDLGAVDSAGGDPQSLGAFVSTPAQPRFSHTHGSAGADNDVELREAGQSPAVLATAAQLDTAVGWLATTPIEIGVYPSPSGDAVAAVLTPFNPVNGDTPMVILNREGDVLAVLNDWRGPMYGSQPVWSPGGHEIVYPTYTTTGAALAITTETGSAEVLAAPAAATTFSTCVWSPTSSATVCQAMEGNRAVWLYTTEDTRRLITAPDRGRPLAWIASSL